MNVALDNDILFKGAAYGLLDELVSPVAASGSIGVLGAAPFVVSNKLERGLLKGNPQAAVNRLRTFLQKAEVLEPSEVEQTLAADFERAAQRAGVNLDVGESLLSSIVIIRHISWLVTGDKRAIRALDALLRQDIRVSVLCGRVRCLEQLVLELVIQGHGQMLRVAICAEPDIDKALSICCSCASNEIDHHQFAEGLNSYIGALRAAAPQILAT